MSVSLGAYNFGMTFHGPMDLDPAPKRALPVEVAGVDGIGMLMLGRGPRLIRVRAAYAGYNSAFLLAAAINFDDDQKGGTPATLAVDDVTATNCQLVAIEPGNFMVDGKNGLWFSANAMLVFQQLSG